MRRSDTRVALVVLLAVLIAAWVVPWAREVLLSIALFVTAVASLAHFEDLAAEKGA